MNKLLTSTIAFWLWFSQSSVLWAQEMKETEPEAEAISRSVLIEEAWRPHHLFVEWGIPSAGFNLSSQVSPDWAIDLGLGIYDPFIIGAYLSLAGRYYLPESWTQDLFAFRVSRFYFEGRGRVGFQPFETSSELSHRTPFGFGSALGLESRWGDLITRVGLQFDKGFNGKRQGGFTVEPVLGVGYQFPPTPDNAYSETYLNQKAQLLATRLDPLIQIESGSSPTQGDHLAFMLANDQWGMGFFKGRDKDKRGYLLEETLGLFGRYYFAPIHPGLQSYLEGVGNFQNDIRFTARLGLEHREPWGGVFNLSLGVGAEKPHDTTDYGVIYDASSSFGYYWSLTPQGLTFKPQ